MNQNQCVPNWDLDHGRPSTVQLPLPSTTITKPVTSHSHSASLSAGHDTSMQDYEMTELAWENGQLTMHGLGLPRFQSKNNIGGAWTDKTSTHVGGTLESIVNQGTHKLPLPLTPIIGTCEYDDDLVPFINHNTIHKTSDPTPVSMAPMDALVPTASTPDLTASKAMMGCSTRVGSCSAAGIGVPGYSDWSVSASGSDKWRGSKRGPENTCEQLRSMTNNEMTSTSFGVSLDNTTRTVTFDDREHDSVCHSKPQRDKVDDEDNQKKATSSAKRSRAAAVHNQSERKRRDKINQRMKTLQKLVPNSNKVDKASMLDEVIDYMKQLQSQVQMFNTMRLPQMMMPLALQQQQLQMSLMASMGMPMGMGMGMGMGIGMNMDQMNMNMNPMGLPNMSGMPTSSVLNPATFMSLAAPTDMGDRVASQPTNMVPKDPLSMFLASQSHSTTMDAYNRMTAMCQQLQQQQQQSLMKHENNNR